MPRPSPVLVQRARTSLAVLGAATLLVGGVNVVAHAAGAADALLLGKKNTAEKSTTLKTKGKGPALKLKAKKGPALSVNTQDLVKNLNAQMVGGSTATQLEPAATVHALLASGGTLAQGTTFRQFSLPAGTYVVNLGAAFETDNSDWFIGCLAGATSVFAEDDTSKVYVGFNINDDSSARIADSTRIVTLPTATTVAYGCLMDTADTEPITAPVPPTVSVRRLSGATPGTSTPFTVNVRQARGLTR
jgi:hypothetical protein